MQNEPFQFCDHNFASYSLIKLYNLRASVASQGFRITYIYLSDTSTLSLCDL